MNVNYSTEELLAKAYFMLSEHEKTNNVKLNDTEAKDFIKQAIKEIKSPPLW